MPHLTRTFYLFTGIHSFLLGLLPIFIPVILWDKGLDISNIAYFISLTALGFVFALMYWDRLRANKHWAHIFALSFVFQSLLVVLLLWGDLDYLLSFGALINGAAGCFYWSTQRILFQAVTQQGKTGNTFGNFQIVVVLLLKMGVLVGSFLLVNDYFIVMLAVSCGMSLLGYFITLQQLKSQSNLFTLKQVSAFSIKQIWQFKDQHHSKLIFIVDGLFLFLESYFWVLTIYLLTQQNVMQLGIIIVVLSVLLALIFFLIKNRIDGIPQQKIYLIAVVGYVISWLLRGELNIEMGSTLLYCGLLLVAFLSNFFRLAFNKRFYDIAHQDQATQYILCKSYYSQMMLIVFFALIAVVIPTGAVPLQQLHFIYFFSAPIALVYIFYARKDTLIQSVR